MRDSGVYWLGEIARDWDVVPAWHVMRERGERSRPHDIHLTPSQTHGVVAQQEFMAITGNRVVQNYAGADNMKHVEAGDFIIHLRSFQGGIEGSTLAGKVSNAYTVLVPHPNVIFGYFQWFMKSAPLIEGLASSTDQLRDGQSINFSRFSRLSLPLPPLETQQRIADYLDRETAEIDAAVADLDRYVELLEKRKKLQINLAFAPIIDAGEIAPLGIFYSIFNGDRGENYPKAEEITDQGIPFLNAGDIRNGSVNLGSAKFVTQDKYNKMGGAKLRSGDILFCLRGSLGKHGIVNFEEGSVASSLCVIRSFNLASHNSQFLNYFMDTTFFSEQILFSENGSAQPNLSGESLARFRIPSISLSRQKSILRDLNRETGEVGSLLAESTQLRELLLKRRSVLIADVVTGRKQV